MTHNIALLFSNYGPYHIARLESLGSDTYHNSIQAIGIELSRSEKKYPWQSQLQSTRLPIISIIENISLEDTWFLTLIPKLTATLKEVDPKILAISGYFNPLMLVALFWCRLRSRPAILFSETTESDFTRVWWKEKIKGFIVRQFKAALVGGEPHKNYLVKLGIPEEAIFTGYDVVGNQVFHPQQIEHYAKPLNKPFFLSINRFVSKKNIFRLVDAYDKYRQESGDETWDLVLCGDGELRSQIEQQIKDLNLEQFIHLPGFLQQEEMLPYFAHAGCFVHASTMEQWGLVVNEAMAAGLPVLVSERCGCFADLVIKGVNGFGFDPYNSEQLTKLMLKISSDDCDREKMGQASLKHIEKYSPDYFAQGFVKAVEYATTHS